MSLHSRCFAILLAMLLLAAPLAATAQQADDDDDFSKVFRLQRGSAAIDDELDLEDEELDVWEPGIDAGSVELSLTLGFMNLAQTLLQHPQMIYKYTPEYTYWGDVEINGESAFNPTLRMGYNVAPWFCLEGYGGISISQYEAEITDRHARKNEEGATPWDNPPLSEFDAENRSLITLQTGIAAMLYPFNMGGEGDGRLHPFLAANVGRIWYDMNSNFTDGAAGTNDLGVGGGFRFLADRNISLRVDIMYHFNSLEFTPADNFAERDEGTTVVPLNEYPVQSDGGFLERPVATFESQDLNYLAWSVGVHGSF